MKNYIQFINEGVKNKMKPKSEKEISEGMDKLMDKLRAVSEDTKPGFQAEELSNYLQNIYDDRNQLLMDLFEEGLSSDDVLMAVVDDLSNAKTERELKYKLKVQGWMYNLIKKNKDKLYLDDLWLFQ